MFNKAVSYKFTFKNIYHVLFQNEYDRRLFKKLKILKSPSSVIPGSGIDTKYYKVTKYPDNKIINFLLISRILWNKGIKEYVEAARFLKSKYDNVNFQLLGSIEKEVKSEISLKQIESWEKEKLINYLGMQNILQKN